MQFKNKISKILMKKCRFKDDPINPLPVKSVVGELNKHSINQYFFILNQIQVDFIPIKVEVWG